MITTKAAQAKVTLLNEWYRCRDCGGDRWIYDPRSSDARDPGVFCWDCDACGMPGPITFDATVVQWLEPAGRSLWRLARICP